MTIKEFLLWVCWVCFFLATLASIVGGPWNTFGHHTALTDLAFDSWVSYFIYTERQKKKNKSDE